jgi:hypothetical protein
MDSEAFKERVARLKEVNEEIAKLDPAIRAAAFELLADYVTGNSTPPAPPAANAGAGVAAQPGGMDRTAFFTKHPANKPSDNIFIIAAYLYSTYGSAPFRLDDVREIAGAVGMTIPASPDMTLRQATRDGKQMFHSTGRNRYVPTVHGELYLQKTYNVTKGTQKRDAD